MIFRYRSPLGAFVIAPRECGFFELLFGDEVLERCRTPDEAAIRVFQRTTGCTEWDTCDAVRETEVPERLEQWECWRISRH